MGGQRLGKTVVNVTFAEICTHLCLSKYYLRARFAHLGNARKCHIVFDLDCFAKVKCNHKIDKYLLFVQRLSIELVCSTWQNRSKICNCQYFALAGKRPTKSLNCTDLLGQ